jgi:hypothetical protein
MTTSGFEPLDLRIERAHRTALVRTVVLSALVVAAAAAFLWFIVNQAEQANARLHDLNAQIDAAKTAAATADARVAAANAQAAQAGQRVAAAEAARTKAEADLKSAHDARTKAEADLKTAQEALASAVDQTAKLRQQIGDLERRLAASQKALADALNLEKHVYKLNWDELKMIAADSGAAAYLLEKIAQQKDRVHWGMSNTEAGGYNSPGFATLILQRADRLPAGRALADLKRDDGPPHLGDIVLYDSGYALFYFRDHQRREFVIGMTPFGVLALNYDFGVKRQGILRTGVSPR